LRGRISLPRESRKKEEIVLVFAEGDAAADARAAGATFVGGDELIPKVCPSGYTAGLLWRKIHYLTLRLSPLPLTNKVLSGEIAPTKVISTPAMLPTIAPKLARFLGPKGLMPVAKRGTVRDDVAEAISEARGLLDWKGDKQGHVRAGEWSGLYWMSVR
jgi:large subunit ribosomal protein L1